MAERQQLEAMVELDAVGKGWHKGTVLATKAERDKSTKSISNIDTPKEAYRSGDRLVDGTERSRRTE